MGNKDLHDLEAMGYAVQHDARGVPMIEVPEERRGGRGNSLRNNSVLKI